MIFSCSNIKTKKENFPNVFVTFMFLLKNHRKKNQSERRKNSRAQSINSTIFKMASTVKCDQVYPVTYSNILKYPKLAL